MESRILDETLNEKILERIKWRHAICPSGTVADRPCFVQREMPIIRILIEKTHPRLCLVTQSDWTDNLVQTGVVWSLHDHAMLHALSECYLIFHQPAKHHKMLHMLHLDTCAWFPVNNILRPTIKFQNALDEALQYWPTDPPMAWQSLCKLWQEFGFLWPQKIILGIIVLCPIHITREGVLIVFRLHIGHKIHVKRMFKQTEKDRLYHLRLTKDEVNAELQVQVSALQQRLRQGIYVYAYQFVSLDT